MTAPPPNRQKMVITKTETEYNVKSLRFLLLTITIMFLVIASLMIILGISIYSYYHSFSYFYESAKTGRIFTPSVLTVLLGLLLLIVWSFGFIGTLKQSTCMVNSYAVSLAVILLIKFIVVVLAFTMKNSLMKYITIPVQDYSVDRELQAEIDTLQLALNCCGSDSYLDYAGVEFNGNQSTVVVSDNINGDMITMVLPETCCITKGDVFCTRMRTTGCKDALYNLIIQNSGVIGVLGVSVMFVQLLGIIFALLLARSIRRLKSERVLLAWKRKEQAILARNGNITQDQNSIYIVHPESSSA